MGDDFDEKVLGTEKELVKNEAGDTNSKGLWIEGTIENWGIGTNGYH
jgi:hypothetical protein